ncbi:MAG: 50S ribosomal protein L13 [Candidatus Nealsonbacteria bacterium RIFOXYB1_FULL_40_15]|uniref:Large ribosomal subunit protein uL13 n=2 Tax=Candidatus Nealsoniibacteriota TaxID=1817911 RepID=A0A1G2ELN8_9BACT|nr:MAG: 50S ribosomal protein L13 [Candidatus Nealsonbacteria bacterium RIFOXYC1_FULL_40_7]OGZ27791.1 MAG: 50S ribosomal protein L13 [Candidatus Nealsonbacteria bacterium RIFOXYB1_FULL_40_15]OGZ28632.1 MAG: 50S ribosomal protein L13 [Candidatus Nealsonbacteria bacterium RIFOXYD1_FULL_39_11]
MERQTHTIDAKGKILGRLATEIAVLLRGKDNPCFALNKDEGGVVVVQNADMIKVTGKKDQQKLYYRHSGYLGGLKSVPYSELGPKNALKKAVYGMLPKNKLRAEQIKRLKFE